MAGRRPTPRARRDAGAPRGWAAAATRAALALAACGLAPIATADVAAPLPDAATLPQRAERPIETGPGARLTDIRVIGVGVEALRAPIEAVRAEAIARVEARDGIWRAGDLRALRDAVTTAYVERGYVNSGALIPPQDLSDGVLEIQVVEGRLVEIVGAMTTPSILGSAVAEADFAAARAADPSARRPTFFAARREPDDLSWRPFQLRRGYVDRVLRPVEDAPLNTADLRERFQLLVGDPAIGRMDARLEPGAKPGEARLRLDVEEAPPFSLTGSFASERSPSIGGERGAGVATVRNLLGLGDVLRAELGGSRGSFDGDFAYDAPLQPQGLTLHLFTDFSDAEVVEDPLTDLDILSESLTYGAGLSAPLAKGADFDDQTGDALTYELRLRGDVSRTRTENALLGAPFDFSPGSVDGVAETTRADLALEGTLQARDTVLVGRVSASFGLDGPDSDVAGAPPDDFVYYRGQAQIAHVLFEDLEHQIIARGDLQLSPSTLYAADRYSFGGVDSVRGYRVSAVTADNAAVGSIEYRVGLGPLGREAGTRFFDGWSVGAFLDAGRGWNSDLDDPIDDRLVSVGAQVNLALFDRIDGSIYYGERLEDVVEPSEETLQDTGFGFRLRLKAF